MADAPSTPSSGSSPAPASTPAASHSSDQTPGVKSSPHNPQAEKWAREGGPNGTKMAKDGRPSSQVPVKPGAPPEKTTEEGIQDIKDKLGKAQHEKNIEEMARRVWKLKDGDRQVELDSEDKLIAYAQKGLGLDKKVSDLSRKQREAEQLLQLALDNPDEFYRKAGKDPARIYEERLIEQLKQQEAMAQLSPEARRWHEEKQQMNAQIEAERRELAQMKQAQRQAQINQRMQEIDQTLLNVLQDPSVNLPKTELTVSRMVDMMLQFDEQGIEADPKHIAAFVAQEMEQEQLQFWDSMSGEQMLAKVPKKILDKLRKADLEAFRKARAPGNHQDVAPVPQKAPEGSEERTKAKVMSKAEWNDWLARFEK